VLAAASAISTAGWSALDSGAVASVHDISVSPVTVSVSGRIWWDNISASWVQSHRRVTLAGEFLQLTLAGQATIK
jgi:hypothetical protein